MRERRAAIHGMACGVSALDACVIVGGVFMSVSAVFSLFASAIGAAVNGWTVVVLPGVVSAAALVAVWRLGVAPIYSAMSQSVLQAIVVVAVINSLFTPMILGVLLLPAGGVSLLWTVFGALWAATALAAVVNAVRNRVRGDRTSIPLDAMSLTATVAALASTGALLASGMTGLLYGIVFLGGLFGASAGVGFLIVDQTFEEAAPEMSNVAAPSRWRDLAHG